ncbi:TPA: acetyltransferase [Vibrio cholerae]|nr:acetyltransferase [Vibrio cholerae]
MVTVVVIEFSVMRCQPLRRALCRCRKKQLSQNLIKV